MKWCSFRIFYTESQKEKKSTKKPVNFNPFGRVGILNSENLGHSPDKSRKPRKKSWKVQFPFFVFLNFCLLLYDIFSSFKLDEWWRDMENLFWGHNPWKIKFLRFFFLVGKISRKHGIFVWQDFWEIWDAGQNLDDSKPWPEFSHFCRDFFFKWKVPIEENSFFRTKNLSLNKYIWDKGTLKKI